MELGCDSRRQLSCGWAWVLVLEVRSQAGLVAL